MYQNCKQNNYNKILCKKTAKEKVIKNIYFNLKFTLTKPIKQVLNLAAIFKLRKELSRKMTNRENA